MDESNSQRRGSGSAWTRTDSDRGAGVRRSVRTALVVSTLLVASAACGSSTGLVHELSVTISTTTTAATVGEPVDFDFSATGPLVVGIIVAYGDGVADSVETATGVTSVMGRFAHTFETAESFLVEAIVVDAQLGRLSDTVAVNITTP